MRKPCIYLMAALFLIVSLPIFAVGSQPHLISVIGYEAADNNRQWQDNLFFQRMAQRTGLQFSFSQYADLDAYKAHLKGLRKDDPDLPAVLYKARLDYDTAADLYEEGVLVDLAPYLQEYAPNFFLMMQQNPEIERAIMLQDGSVVALPFISRLPGQNILWINKAWLEELKIPMPRTIEELEQALTAFKNRDPNRNGRNDEIPLSFIGPYDLKYLSHAWGLIANDFNIFVDGGTVKFMPLEDRFTDFITWCRDMYAAGNLDRDGFTTADTLRRQTDAKAVNRYGAFFGPLPTTVVPMEWTGQYQALLPLSYEGETVYRAVASRVFFGTFALTAACDDIPGMLSWVDYLYTQEGAVLAGIGLEGEDFVRDGDGSWRLLRETGDRTYFSQVIIATDQSAPGISNEDFQCYYTDPIVRSLTEQTERVAQVSSLPFPDLPLTRDEAEKIAPLQSSIARYVDESIARFVLGEWQITDGQLEEFQNELEALGLNEFFAFWQNVYDRGMRGNGL